MLPKSIVLTFISSILLSGPPPANAQQVADTLFKPSIGSPAFNTGAGPTVLIDEAHNNYHTMNGRYLVFARLLQMDGFVVVPQREQYSNATLKQAKILVIANALSKDNLHYWTLPQVSAFESDEIAVIRDWVRDGGSLLLIADHMPFAGAVEDLAMEFGVAMGNGYAVDIETEDGTMRFSRADSSLADHPITRGRNRSERVDSVVAFTGQAMRLLGKGDPLMTLGNNTMLLMPEVAGQFSRLTPAILSGEMLQGAVLQFGKGKVAVFGEASMFSAQVHGPNRTPMGMNDPTALQNPQFLLNVLHWLAGLL